MPLPFASGTTNIDLAVPGTFRLNQSELLLSALYQDPSTIGFLQIGEGFVAADGVHRWNEEALNPSTVTDLTPGGLDNVQTTMVVVAADAAVLDVGSILADEGATGGLALSERIAVVGRGPVDGFGNVTLQIVRGAQTTTPTTHDALATWAIIAQPIPDNSDLGADKTRPLIPHYNILQRQDINVNLGSEVIRAAADGVYPGVNNMIHKQINNRLAELKRILNRSVLYGIGTVGDGSISAAGVLAGNNSTAWGMIPMLDPAISTGYNADATVYDYSAHYGPGLLDQATNDVNELAFDNGVLDDYLLLPAPGARSFARLYQDRIRLVQDDTTRGMFVKKFMTDLGNELSLVVDPYLNRVNGNIDMVLLDSRRWAICPFDNAFMTYITSPSFRAGDAARCIVSYTLEGRNTGSDSGQASFYMSNVSVA